MSDIEWIEEDLYFAMDLWVSYRHSGDRYQVERTIRLTEDPDDPNRCFISIPAHIADQADNEASVYCHTITERHSLMYWEDITKEEYEEAVRISN